MIKKFLYLSLFVIAILFSQCSGDPIQKDLLNYINTELPKVASLETEAVDAYASVSGANYTSDQAMSDKIKSIVIPKYTEFSEKLKAIKPATPEVEKIHSEYVEASKDQLEAFNLVIDAIAKQDITEIEKANKDLRAGRELIAKWNADLNEMCKNHEVKIEK